MAGFTFKKEPQETGLAGVGNPWPSTQIKYEKMQVGIISAPNWQTKDQRWGIQFTVKCEGGCGWKWVHLKARFETEADARGFIKNNEAKLLALNLHKLED